MGTYRTFDSHTDADDAQRRTVVDAALAGGTTFFDSSPMYGEAERVLSRALEGRRDQVLVATKVWTDDDAESERQIKRSLDFYGGLVDFYQVHNLVRWQKRLDQLQRLKDEGRVRAIGLTHYQHDVFPEMMQAMRDPRVEAVQLPYHPLDREVEREVLPLAADLGLGVVLMRPMGVGPLARKQVAPEKLQPLARFGIRTWAQAVLKWSLSDPRVTVAIPATKDPDHARDNAEIGSPPWFGPDERDYVLQLAEEA